MGKPASKKQKIEFAQELVRNGKRFGPAYRAVFKATGSAQSVSTMGKRLFNDVEVQLKYNEILNNAKAETARAIADQKANEERADRDAAEIRAEIMNRALEISKGNTPDVTKVYDDKGNLLSTKETFRKADQLAALKFALEMLEDKNSETSIRVELVGGVNDLAN